MGLNWGAGLQAAGQSLGQWAAYQQQLAHEEKIRQQQLADLAAANARVDAEHVRMYGPVIPAVVPAHPASPAMGPITMPPEGPDAESYTWSGSPAIPAIPAITTYPYAGVDLPRDQFGGQYAGQALDSYLQAHPVKTDKPVVPPINYVVTDSSGAQTPFSTTDAPDAVVGRMTEGDRRAVLSGVGPDGAIHITTSTVPKEFAPKDTAATDDKRLKTMSTMIDRTVKGWVGAPEQTYRDVWGTDAKGKPKATKQQVTVPGGGTLFTPTEVGYLSGPESLVGLTTNALTDSLAARGITEWPDRLPPEIGTNIRKDLMPTLDIAPMAMPDVAKVLGLPPEWRFDPGKTDSTADDSFITNNIRFWKDSRMSVPDALRAALANKANDLGYLDHQSVKKTLMDYGIDLDSLFKGGSGVVDKSLYEDALGIKSGA